MRSLLSLFTVGMLCWVFAWISFLSAVPKSENTDAQRVDAIVVLTGGARRVEHGFMRLSEGKAPLLFISGVGENAQLDQLFEAHTTAAIRRRIDALKPRILLDHNARSTRMNADETAAFVKENNIRSIRLITANYHMPRSMLELHASTPHLTIIPDAAFPKGFTAHSWWHHGSARYLLLSEFHKTLAVKLREWIRHV